VLWHKGGPLANEVDNLVSVNAAAPDQITIMLPVVGPTAVARVLTVKIHKRMILVTQSSFLAQSSHKMQVLCALRSNRHWLRKVVPETLG
jgi:hypothetical protein